MLATFPHRRVPPSDSQALLCGPARLSAAFSVFDNLFIKTPKSNGCQACCPPPPNRTAMDTACPRGGSPALCD